MRLLIFSATLITMITIITVGTPHLTFAQEGINEYIKRLAGFEQCRLIHIKENKKTSEKILKEIGNDYCVLLDELGKNYNTQELSQFLESQKNQSRSCSFIIGGPDGHEEMIRNRADALWSLSRLTFPHDIATLLCCEALYRSSSILKGHPYHRD